VDLLHRDAVLSLLRSLAQEGIAVLTTVGESTGLFGADRALSLSSGEMHGHVIPELAPVVRLPQRAIA
jgi:ABC-type sugar transport system ATPase subunit